MSDLALHLGTVHRWAERLVRVRASTRIPSSEMGLSEGPVGSAWIAEGGAALVATLRAVDPSTPMWAWGADRHAAFWPRRQLHETLVHRFDLELALGVTPWAAASIADDAIDEFLVNLAPAAAFSPNVNRLRGTGETLLIASRDRSWMVTLAPEAFEIVASDAGAPASAVLRGPALDVLLVLYRRSPVEASGVTIDGDTRVAEHWLAQSALE